jgi:hypothetical protein
MKKIVFVTRRAVIAIITDGGLVAELLSQRGIVGIIVDSILPVLICEIFFIFVAELSLNRRSSILTPRL